MLFWSYFSTHAVVWETLAPKVQVVDENNKRTKHSPVPDLSNKKIRFDLRFILFLQIAKNNNISIQRPMRLRQAGFHCMRPSTHDGFCSNALPSPAFHCVRLSTHQRRWIPLQRTAIACLQKSNCHHCHFNGKRSRVPCEVVRFETWLLANVYGRRFDLTV